MEEMKKKEIDLIKSLRNPATSGRMMFSTA
jgi:hypothetical protein